MGICFIDITFKKLLFHMHAQLGQYAATPQKTASEGYYRMFDNPERSLTVAGSVDEALAACRQGAAILAGGTWLMRDSRRKQSIPDSPVSLRRISSFTAVEIDAGRIVVGAAATHDVLARSLSDIAGFEAVVAAADLVPALLADAILSRVILLPRALFVSAHARLPLRRAGYYPIAIVPVALGADGQIRVAVGSVEDVAPRWTSLENAFAAQLGGRPADAESAVALALECDDFHGRAGVEADGWYRLQVLPTLLRRSMAELFRKDAAR